MKLRMPLLVSLLISPLLITPLLITLGVFALDRFGKWMAERTFTELQGTDGSFTLFDRLFVELVLIYNPGITFGLLADAALNQQVMGAVTALAGLVIFWMAYKTAHPGFALVAGGALGNSFDRFSRGGVVDFIDIYWRSDSASYHWPAFNPADAAIVVGVFWLILAGPVAKR